MGKYSDEIKRLTLDPGARRLAEIADLLSSQIADIRTRCCGDDGPSISPEPQPVPGAEPPK